MDKPVITYCQIDNNGVSVDGTAVFSFDSEVDLTSNLKQYYKSLEIDYSKLYKMDNLSKLGVLGVEAMKSKTPSEFDYEDDRTSVILFNSYSSLDTDAKHQEAVNKKSPSPAVFVYTLPNIVIGELSIRNKWYGESAFFVSKDIDSHQIWEQITLQKHLGKSDKALIGWIDCFGSAFKCILALVNLQEDITKQDWIKEIFK